MRENNREPRKPFSRLSSGLWFVPLACGLAGVGLSVGTIAIDNAYDYKLVPQSISGGVEAIRIVNLHEVIPVHYNDYEVFKVAAG